MPISSDPARTAPYWLACDAETPEANRPTFDCRFLTRREMRRVDELTKQAYAAKDDAQCYGLLIDALRVGVAGWRNMFDPDGQPVPFDLSAIDGILTDQELWELVYGYPRAVSRTEHDRFLSRSPSQPTGASSATVAATSATTSPAPPAPSGSAVDAAPVTAATIVTSAVA